VTPVFMSSLERPWSVPPAAAAALAWVAVALVVGSHAYMLLLPSPPHRPLATMTQHAYANLAAGLAVAFLVATHSLA